MHFLEGRQDQVWQAVLYWPLVVTKSYKQYTHAVLVFGELLFCADLVCVVMLVQASRV